MDDKKAPQKGAGKRQLRAAQISEARETVPELFTQELDEAYEKYTNDISGKGAQRELLGIFMFSAAVAAKMKKLANSRIRDKGDKTGVYIEGKAVIKRLSTPQFVNNINAILESNPRLLEGMSVPLSGILGRSLVDMFR